VTRGQLTSATCEAGASGTWLSEPGALTAEIGATVLTRTVGRGNGTSRWVVGMLMGLALCCRQDITEPSATIRLSNSTVTFVSSAWRPQPERVSVQNAGGGTLTGLLATVAYPVGQPTGWLTADLTATTAPATLVLGATGVRLASANYSATVSVASPLCEE
jgi:hypothetical protein